MASTSTTSTSMSSRDIRGVPKPAAGLGCEKMRWVRIEDVGDSEFLIDEQTDKFRFAKWKTLWRTSLSDPGGRPATAQPLLLGITARGCLSENSRCDRDPLFSTGASLSTDSFISAASLLRGAQCADDARWGRGNDVELGRRERTVPRLRGKPEVRPVPLPSIMMWELDGTSTLNRSTSAASVFKSGGAGGAPAARPAGDCRCACKDAPLARLQTRTRAKNESLCQRRLLGRVTSTATARLPDF